MNLNAEILPTEFNVNVMCVTKIASFFQTVDIQCVPLTIFVYPIYCTLPGISHHTYVSRMSGTTSFCLWMLSFVWYMGQTLSCSTYSIINVVVSMPVTKCFL